MSAKEKCFNKFATDHSKELVKKFYHVLKMEKLFYKFQKDYLPLSGLSGVEEGRVRTRVYHYGDALLIDDGVWYRPVLPGSFSSEEAPEVIKDVVMLKNMITPINDALSLVGTKNKLIRLYLKHHFLDFGGKRKIRQTDMFFEFLFGIIGMVLFAVSLFVLLSIAISKAVILPFGVAIVIAAVFILPVIVPFARSNIF